MKLLIMQSPPTSYHSSLLGPNILLSAMFSNTLNLCSSFSVKDQVSNSYKTAGKIMVLYILIFKFFERRRKTRDPELNGSKCSPKLMCS